MNHGGRESRRHPALLRFLAGHLIAGCCGALVFLAGLLVTDYGGIAGMVFDSSDGLLFLLLLAFGLCLTFGSVAMGVGIMRDRD